MQAIRSRLSSRYRGLPTLLGGPLLPPPPLVPPDRPPACAGCSTLTAPLQTLSALQEAFGWASRELQAPLQPNLRMPVASNTKAMVAAAMYQLAQQGQLNVSASAADFLDPKDFPDLKGGCLGGPGRGLEDYKYGSTSTHKPLRCRDHRVPRGSLAPPRRHATARHADRPPLLLRSLWCREVVPPAGLSPKRRPL